METLIENPVVSDVQAENKTDKKPKTERKPRKPKPEKNPVDNTVPVPVPAVELPKFTAQTETKVHIKKDFSTVADFLRKEALSILAIVNPVARQTAVDKLRETVQTYEKDGLKMSDFIPEPCFCLAKKGVTKKDGNTTKIKDLFFAVKVSKTGTVESTLNGETQSKQLNIMRFLLAGSETGQAIKILFGFSELKELSREDYGKRFDSTALIVGKEVADNVKKELVKAGTKREIGEIVKDSHSSINLTGKLQRRAVTLAGKEANDKLNATALALRAKLADNSAKKKSTK